MACNNNLKNRNYKSVVTAYNNTTQAYVATGTQLNILGQPALDAGCSGNAVNGGFNILHSGTYRISYDVTSVPTAAGIQTLQMYNNTLAMPCAVVSDTTVANSTITQHIETTVYIPVCCNNQPTITLNVSGVAGEVTHICANVTRLA